jgi:hypothetical protein
MTPIFNRYIHTWPPSPIYNLQYDGFITNLTAQIYITAGVTNHVKIAIADYIDPLWDSAVFIKAETLFHDKVN